jgi:hypothetical protein
MEETLKGETDCACLKNEFVAYVSDLVEGLVGESVVQWRQVHCCSSLGYLISTRDLEDRICLVRGKLVMVEEEEEAPLFGML